LDFFFQPKLSEEQPHLDNEESVHALKVLRHSVGDKIDVTDGEGHLFHCQISSTSGKVCALKILSKEHFEKPHYHIHIVLSPTKSSDRNEWFVEKATEIGVQKISFMDTQRSERSKINLERMNKVAIAAMKQSGQVWLPHLEGMISFAKILQTVADQKFIATADKKDRSLLFRLAKKRKRYITLIGPEGDFSNDEMQKAIDAGFLPVSLGNNTLRTETAGVAACHLLNFIQDDTFH
jgi:16S rRNA (uracil1498-N3)-methyltransferase